MSSGKPSAGNETERESEPAASSRRAKASGVETKVLTRPEEFKVDLTLIPGEPTKGIVTKVFCGSTILLFRFICVIY